MGTPAFYLLLLLFLGVLRLPGSRATGSHFLRYFFTGVSQPGPGLPAFTAVAYVDDQQLGRFDSNGGMSIPSAWWILETDVGDHLKDLKRIATGLSRDSQDSLRDLPRYYNQTEGGSHSIQTMFGCEVEDNGTVKNGYYQVGYDGRDYITLERNHKNMTWVTADTVAQITKRMWEENEKFTSRLRNHLECDCPKWMKIYLRLGGDSLNRKTPPSVGVTRHPSPDGDDVTLRCRALGFYPSRIRMRWQRDGEDLTRDTEHVETRPGGDGTFQKWTAAVGVPQGQEWRYACTVQHDGLAEPLIVRWEPSPPISGFVAAIFILTAGILAVVLWRKRLGGRDGNDKLTGT
ncbi:class I histocompatibility antigen, Non-RT1.A alpha-1 chain-like isoform X2 [Tachyglossus aculeatus]|uniref:class I histocompatibility antigen, Non-RT1.A alpha-1 chain-like isoform X2 n=1 Tax=Tachyglossus aculeatus TaxID=9261 RepID=UPI0018F3BA81|nr:class I histocompatibility antigen, Non-RT1.A alpha-1 chain-like isoform X2 [Tachyglossus aculeatus]